MKPFTITLVLAFAAGSLTAFAAERSIMQKDKVFSETTVEVKKGDTVTFVNDDTVSHNVMSTTSGHTFNLGSQVPGASSKYTFAKAGEINVMCAMHPRMKMTVKVTE